MSSSEFEITKENAPYAPEEELGVYKAKRWTWREKQKAVMSASKILDDKKGLIELDLVDFQAEQILRCVTPPEGFEWDKERINNLDPDVGDAVLDACRKVNGTTLSERTRFLGLSEEEENIPG